MAPSLSPILVTGGCGFIGFHLVKGLLALEAQSEIHVIDINITRNTHPGVTYHKCDITSAADVEAVFLQAKPRTIFHVACPDSMVQQPDIFRCVNVGGVKNILSSAQKVGTVRALVNTSTSSVIHDNVSDLIDADDTLPVLQYPAQKRVYTLIKAEAEADLIGANRSDGDSSMLVVSLRPATVFGERDTICMGKIVATCRAGRGHVQIGPGNNEYDFMYVSNLVDAHLLAAQALLDAYGKPPPAAENRIDGQCFNVTNHERILFWDFQRAVSASVGLPVKPEDIKVVPAWVALLGASIVEWVTWMRTFGKGRPALTWETVRLTIITRTLNDDRFQRITGYKPRVSIHEGLAIAGKWFVEEQKKAEATKAQDPKKTI
ncbi:Sterol-4-alpha-carboxylate 3-dehydrogenase, decarboxylating [Cytospora mali]|uniref:Sterol-4-alpha-carboxylate 3-dehydrogenase, decarboxylating n=1 Tax=Cytospora mali TaxID=578113 RepID=A0A194V2P5_CYTMA|nr:Sterol-4-alpha-carboxylate 3-dehydrogenase, decarboxylating [Valsa mali var. pyri (nom. inval.)]